jgi:hypothetical protein
LKTNNPVFWGFQTDTIPIISCHGYIRLPVWLQDLQAVENRCLSDVIAFSWDTFSVLAPWSAIRLSGFWIEPCNGHCDLWFYGVLLDEIDSFTSMIAGPTGSGKSMLVRRFAPNIKHMVTPKPDRIFWCYGEYQTLHGIVEGI